MEVIKTAIKVLVIIELKVFKDTKGYFFKSYFQRYFEDKVRKIKFVQDHESMPSYVVKRSLLFLVPSYTQIKFV